MQKISIQKLKWLKSLHLKKNRDKEGLFIIEGEKICSEVIADSPHDIVMVIYLSSFENSIPENLKGISHIASENQLKRISALKTPNNVIIVLNKMQNIAFNVNQKSILLEDIQDPGNLGTIIRTADWFGIHQLICSPKCADIYNTKTIQASMGSFLRVSVISTELAPFIKKNKLKVGGAVLKGKSVNNSDVSKIDAVLFGNESKGISEELRHLIDYPIKIDGFGGAESLNVSVAAAIIIFEWAK